MQAVQPSQENVHKILSTCLSFQRHTYYCFGNTKIYICLSMKINSNLNYRSPKQVSAAWQPSASKK